MQSFWSWGVPAALVIGYLFGSIPFGLILTRVFGKGDIRDIGSGNIGATNVLRTGSKLLAALTVLGDGLKGTAAVLVGAALFDQPGALAAGLGAFLGHLFPVWLGFRGGKGVATYIGILLGFDWRFALGFALIWLAVAAITRYSSASALVASAITPIALLLLGVIDIGLLTVILSVLLWFRHRDNISRLRAGTEGRIGQS